ncbi:DUF4257 domain-containing protein [Ornithinibacillus scapharcae]|uniref:DUF4257 domain-containing protein n=1 Tax=Ornithinibacillus scapharcae TaxID=1147159 RepID=UPI000225BDD4|nr:DUF4257 domain-containing protein [Ornithinibacillus scapharcae]
MIIIGKLFLSVFLGGLIGFLVSLMNSRRELDKPYKVDGKNYFGFIYDVFVGAIAALLAITILVPGALDLEYPSIIGISIIAGLSGESILLSQQLHASEEKRKMLEEAEEKLIAEIKRQIDSEKSKE